MQCKGRAGVPPACSIPRRTVSVSAEDILKGRERESEGTRSAATACGACGEPEACGVPRALTGIALLSPLPSPGSDRPWLSLCWGVAAEGELTLVHLGAVWSLEEVALSKNVVCEGGERRRE